MLFFKRIFIDCNCGLHVCGHIFLKIFTATLDRRPQLILPIFRPIGIAFGSFVKPRACGWLAGCFSNGARFSSSDGLGCGLAVGLQIAFERRPSFFRSIYVDNYVRLN
jgi:hypothetical protein